MRYLHRALAMGLVCCVAIACSDERRSDVEPGSDADTDTDTDENDTSTEYDGPVIPETCAQAAQATTTVGCLFYAVDLDSHDSVEDQQYAVAVSNVHQSTSADVTVFKGSTSGWTEQESAEVQPMDLHVFNLPDYHMDGSGVMPKGSYRIESDIPIIAYQFNPVDGASSYLSDASMLIPTTSLSLTYDVVGWKQNAGDGDMRAYFTVVATEDGTEVEVTPSVAPLPGTDVPGTGETFTVSLGEGDVLEVETNNQGDSLTGTRIVANDAHPIIVFSGQECAFIPETVYACDHLEEQLPGMRFWGKEFVASRMPVRSTIEPAETALWQVYASEDGTEVSFSGTSGVTGLPPTSYLAQGEVLEFYVGGSLTEPGDFFVSANKPIGLMQYMIGAQNVGSGDIGDPAMVYVSPVEQFLPRYVVLVPGTWINDALIITRGLGAEVLLDDVAIPDSEFQTVASTGWEVARVIVPDGVHSLRSGNNAAGLGVIVVGWDDYDSYAYTGGMGMGEINPGVE